MKFAIAYFSETGTTKQAAERLGQVLKVTPLAIEATVPYTNADLNWQNDNSRANREQSGQATPPTAKPLTLPDFNVLFLGYPTWWGVPPMVIHDFLAHQTLAGKVVVPFATSGSSSPERGEAIIKQLLPKSDVKPAKRVNNFSIAQLKAWVQQLGY
ncbi:flavodoxin [Lactobacillus sp. 3B(2020)]|uniref:flavodoxin n=1 Tax=Lactobacillus sp. 3B(2020) TaxID=2695882 RepID=UPI0015DE0225|nr:flavodoxin [Lactobacillus sp. 3B(2020)]QLL70652.1 flavodoxin [Lactobacillus sp. 3B(2020)]